MRSLGGCKNDSNKFLYILDYVGQPNTVLDVPFFFISREMRVTTLLSLRPLRP